MHFFSKKKLTYRIVIAGIVAAIALIGVVLYNQERSEKKPAVQDKIIQKGKTVKEILFDLTPPTNEIPEVPQEVLKSLTPPAPPASSIRRSAPLPAPSVPKDVLKSLTPP